MPGYCYMNANNMRVGKKPPTGLKLTKFLRILRKTIKTIYKTLGDVIRRLGESRYIRLLNACVLRNYTYLYKPFCNRV